MTTERARKAILALAILGAMGVVLGVAVSFSGESELISALLVMVPMSLVFGAIAVGLGPVCRVVTFRADEPWRPLAVHLAGALLTAALWTGLVRIWASLVRSLPGTDGLADPAFRLVFVVGALLYLLAVTGHYLMAEQRRLARAREDARELRTLAREAELESLKSQINPHFLFNSLNSISALCGSDPAGARRMAEKLAGFFRRSVRMTRRHTIPLGEEIDLVRRYLEIERVRFGDRLRFTLEIDEAVSEQPVPPFTLQPLVENSIRHGISRRIEGGTILLRVGTRDDYARITVENDIDPDAEPNGGTGTGLDNVRRRLRAQYGDEAAMRVEAKERRFRVTLAVPLDAEADRTDPKPPGQEDP